MENIELIVFDLGNILVQLGESPFPKEWNMEGTKDSKAWLYDECALKFEKGELSAKLLAEQLITQHNLQQSTDEVISHFAKWIKGLYPSVLETMEQLKGKYKLAILSNTNEIHWPVMMKEFGLEGKFDYYFASFQMKKAKPDIEIYNELIEKTGFKPENILFFDDNLVNIENASKTKINAVHLFGFPAVKKYLYENRFI